MKGELIQLISINTFRDNDDPKCVEEMDFTLFFNSIREHEIKRSGKNAWELGIDFGTISLAKFKVNFKGSVGRNTEYTDEFKFFSEQEGEIYGAEAVCMAYTVSINDYNVPVFTSGFKNAIRALYTASANPDSPESDAEVSRFWENFGTHYMTTVEMGGILTIESRWASKSYNSSALSNRLLISKLLHYNLIQL